ncbi:hypothetical protein [Aquisalibacillus elongatus]|uniref:hypothetical protein n=1 Tax=Aquisalibacillus elongatus TaxID=485577 RepID=UPI0014754825|nr:hypothetical protein [Aquisalibacillus elongatus]
MNNVGHKTLGVVAITLSIIGAAFLMTNHTLSMLENMGKVTFDVIFEPELMGVGFFAVFFPLGLFLLGLTLVKLGQKTLGLALSVATAIMFTGLILAPWLHHTGIMAVAIIFFILSKKDRF